MLYFLSKGYRVIAHDRRGHGRSSAGQRRSRHGSLCCGHLRGCRASRSSRMPSTSAIRPAAGRPRAMSPATASQQGRVAKLVLIGAVPPDHGEDCCQSRWSTNRGVRWPPRQQLAANRSQFYLDSADRPLLRLQPAGRDAVAGPIDIELVAPRDDGRGEGALRWHQGFLGDGFHRGPEDHRPSRRS